MDVGDGVRIALVLAGRAVNIKVIEMARPGPDDR